MVAVWVSAVQVRVSSHTDLVVDALVEQHTERPPVNLARVALALVDLGRQICEGARLAGERFVRGEVGSNILEERLSVSLRESALPVSGVTYEICQVDMAVGVEQHVVRLDVSVHDALLVDVAHGASQLGHPEPHGLLGEGLSRDVEAQVAAVHEVDYDVSGRVSVVGG